MTTVTKQIHFATKSRRKAAVPGPPPEPQEPAGRTPRVAKLMALAIRFDHLLQEGKVADQSELARLAHVTQPRMTQIMNLLHLAPDIQEEILHLPPVEEGRDPITERDLRPITGIPQWAEQRRTWSRVANPVLANNREKPTIGARPSCPRLASERPCPPPAKTS